MKGQNSRRTQKTAEAKITVIMPAYNCGALLGRSLPPLLQMQRQGEVYEVIVVDDGSSDGTAQTAVSLGARVILFEQRHGPAHARNQAARESRGEILWFIDADVVARSDAARQIRQALINEHHAAVFGSYDNSPAARNFLSQYKILSIIIIIRKSAGMFQPSGRAAGPCGSRPFWMLAGSMPYGTPDLRLRISNLGIDCRQLAVGSDTLLNCRRPI